MNLCYLSKALRSESQPQSVIFSPTSQGKESNYSVILSEAKNLTIECHSERSDSVAKNLTAKFRLDVSLHCVSLNMTKNFGGTISIVRFERKLRVNRV